MIFNGINQCWNVQMKVKWKVTYKLPTVPNIKKKKSNISLQFYLRSYADGTQNLNDTNEVFVRTSVGSYRFEGISREFTRKLYDWEQYRGISPTSSTFRLLGPSYVPFLRQTTMETSTDNSPITSKIPNLFNHIE